MPVNFAVKAAITVGMMAVQTALTMSRKIEGPRLDDTKFTGGDYGAALPMVWGLRRLNVPIFWAEEMREVKRRRKTKGGKYNEYTYYGTWAVALAGHEIEGVRRIWFDTHLVFDLSGAGPASPFDFGDTREINKRELQFDRSVATGGKGNSFFAFYPGSETQEVDPRIDAWCSDRYGEGSCPAYRDTAYIVFKDIPLEKIGNRIPQVSVEMVGNVSASYPYESRATAAEFSSVSNVTFSPDFSRILWVEGGSYDMFDTAARARMIGGTFPASIEQGQKLGLFNDGTIYAIAADNESLISIPADGVGASTTIATFLSSEQQNEVRVVEDANGNEHWFTTPWSGGTEFYQGGTQYEMLPLTGVEWSPYEYFPDNSGNVWAVGRKAGVGGTSAYFRRMVTAVESDQPAFVTVTGLPATSGVFGDVSAMDGPVGFILYYDGVLFIIDRETGAVLASNSVGTNESNARVAITNAPRGSGTLFLRDSGASGSTFIEVSLTDLTTVRTLTWADWLSGTVNTAVYDPISHAMITRRTSGGLNVEWRYLDRIGSGGVTLATIATDIAEWCGVEDYDFSALDQTVTGWSATRGSGANMLEPLLDAYDSDIAPHDFTILGIKRTGTASGATLLTEKFVGDPRYGVTVRQASELPRALLIDFADVDADQQPNSVRSDRPLDATQARGEKKIDLTTLAMDVDEARGLADRHFRRVWNERKEISLSLTAQNLALEPGDVRTLSLDGDTITARCISVTVGAGDVLATKWRYDTPSLALQDATGGAAFDGRTVQSIAVPITSKGFVLDIPLLTDSDDDTVPQAYALAAPYASGSWPGAIIYGEVGGEYTEEVAEVLSSAEATWGYLSTAMPYTNPNVWDRGTSLTVTLQVGELTGCTEAAANADPSLNLCAIGSNGRWELVQFTSATLTAPLTYTVSGFKRGRRGTEWAAELHQAGDVFVSLYTAAPQDFGLSDVGVAQSFKAITAGRTNGLPFGYTFAGQSLLPYAPTALEGAKDAGSGDWALSWIRRTRLGGAWTSGTAIPLGEATEEYEVEIMNGATVVRTITALSSAATTYTDAQQVTDFGSTQSSVTFRVYQISATVDRGFMAEATI